MRTTQELSKLNHNTLIREVQRLEYEASHAQMQVEDLKRAPAKHAPDLGDLATEIDALHKQVLEDQKTIAEQTKVIEALRAQVKDIASAEISKLRKELAATKQALKAKGGEEPSA